MLAKAETHSYQWIIRPWDERVESFALSLKVSPLLAQVLLNRGIDSADAGLHFLRPKLNELIRPEAMPGITGAVGDHRDIGRDLGVAFNQGSDSG